MCSLPPRRWSRLFRARPGYDRVRGDQIIPPAFSECVGAHEAHSVWDKDRTHLRDLIEVGLLDASWVARLPSELGVRLQHLLDNPEG